MISLSFSRRTGAQGDFLLPMRVRAEGERLMKSRLLGDHGRSGRDGGRELVALGFGIPHAAFSVGGCVAWGACHVVEHGGLSTSKQPHRADGAQGAENVVGLRGGGGVVVVVCTRSRSLINLPFFSLLFSSFVLLSPPI